MIGKTLDTLKNCNISDIIEYWNWIKKQKEVDTIIEFIECLNKSDSCKQIGCKGKIKFSSGNFQCMGRTTPDGINTLVFSILNKFLLESELFEL